MGVEYELINNTKKERISFAHLNGSKKRELAGNPVQAAIVTWYFLNNQGDEIHFVSDTYDEWPFKTGKRKDTVLFPDKTNEIIGELIENKIIINDGMLYVDPTDQENCFIYNLKNIWLTGET